MMPFKEWIDLQDKWSKLDISDKKKTLKEAGYSPNLSLRPLNLLDDQIKYDIYYILRKA